MRLPKTTPVKIPVKLPFKWPANLPMRPTMIVIAAGVLALSFLIAPKAILAMVALFAGIVLAFRYVSLASITAVALFPVLAWLLDGYRSRPRMLACMALSSLLIVAKHHENIRRLMAGTENRFQTRRG